MTRRHAPARTRLDPEERRVQILSVAARILSRGGIEALQFTDVAAEAGGTRPGIYKFFATREALVEGILRDFETELTRRFHLLRDQGFEGSIGSATGVFIEAF